MDRGASKVKSFSHPRSGSELDWLATDLDDNVGLFSTGGYGPVPRVVADRLDRIEAAVGRLGTSQSLGSVLRVPQVGATSTSGLNRAGEGCTGLIGVRSLSDLIARLTVPARPVVTAAIADEAVREAARLVRLPVRFAAIDALD